MLTWVEKAQRECNQLRQEPEDLILASNKCFITDY